ncbi:AfsR/SARP family transcriptional regulator [Plantactinospora soyae]|uniref:DNA-binding SARP family transcriptional activator/Tfp pilus assembly protein PilF n=1 Tax=Plantactinospora soyae TaxID=1544732 RepID=A0A927M377_9ACTN|nr:BTAD domain-containing putative transcriptional regulator [Plantactinospora soyae]MBE1486057.1 DNA-binding SARP family transcriptional activator/Tfp pilus assembly protein PilF [Plantactinospora soyae]
MIEVRLLGPLEVVADGVSLPLGTPKQQTVLATLAVRPGRLVALEELVDELWPEDPPASAVANTRSYAANLRRMLDGIGTTRGLLVRRGSGYEFRIRPDDVDLIRFADGCRHTGEALARGDLPAAEDLLARTEGLWRGPMLAGAPLGPVLSARRDAVAEQRLGLVDQRAEVYLALRQPQPVIALLREHLRTYPLREHGHTLLMRALYQKGDVSGALTAFTTARSALVKHLGIEPGAELQRLHQAILHRDPALDNADQSDRPQASDRPLPSAVAPAHPDGRGEAASVPPCWLPRPLADFTGRAETVRRLVEAVEGVEATTAVVQVIDGMAGIGKTALAVHMATRLASRYPDAQLFIDLRGHSVNGQVEPSTALVTLLRQLGVPAGRIPPEFDHRVALWRSELAARRSILLLDNAGSSEQVGPLLPSAPGTLVLVTSRRRLLAGDGIPPNSLSGLGRDEAIDMLATVAGRDRVYAEPEAAAAVVERCGYLPLAIRLVGARLAHRTGWRVADLARRLGRDTTVLGEISAEDQNIASAFALSYKPLRKSVQRVFRLLGLYPGEFFQGTTAAALTGLPLSEAEMAIRELVDSHLVEEPVADRFRLHDLLRQYAGGLAATIDPPDQRQAAIDGVLDHYLHATSSVTDPLEAISLATAVKLRQALRSDLIAVLRPIDGSWIEKQRSNIRSLVRLAEDSGHDGYAWRLARSAWRFYYTRGYFDDILETHGHGLRAAERLKDTSAIATMYNYLASAYVRTGSYHKAVAQLKMAIKIRHTIGDTGGVAVSKSNLAVAYWLLGRLDEAIDENRQAISLGRPDEKPITTASFNHGLFLIRLGRYAEALRIHRLGLQQACEDKEQFQIANSLGMIGGARLRMGYEREAIRLLKASIMLRKRIGTHYGEAEVCSDLATAYRRLGELHNAEGQDRVALRLAVEAGERHAESGALNGLGLTLNLLEDHKSAMEMHRQALELATRISHPYEQGRALAAMASHLEPTDLIEAHRHWERALAIFRRMGVPERFEVERRLARLVTPSVDDGTRAARTFSVGDR